MQLLHLSLRPIENLARIISFSRVSLKSLLVREMRGGEGVDGWAEVLYTSGGKKRKRAYSRGVEIAHTHAHMDTYAHSIHAYARNKRKEALLRLAR